MEKNTCAIRRCIRFDCQDVTLYTYVCVCASVC